MGVELSPEEEVEGVGSSLRTRQEEEAIIKVNRERRRNVPKRLWKTKRRNGEWTDEIGPRNWEQRARVKGN